MEDNKKKRPNDIKSAGSSFGSNLELGSGNQKFAENLKERRKGLGLTQKELANKLGIDVHTIQNYESGSLPKGDYLILLAKELNCSTGWLLMGEGDPPDDEKQPPKYMKDETGVGSDYGELKRMYDKLLEKYEILLKEQGKLELKNELLEKENKKLKGSMDPQMEDEEALRQRGSR